MAVVLPYVPQRIRVHLAYPTREAPNVTVDFVDYVKNVASSEIYPTWEPAAIEANVLAIVSFALNRVYTEFYPSQGYDFEITSSTAIDQAFVYGRSTFDSIDRIVDRVFNDYLRRPGFVEPLAAKFCNGTTVTCEGLSQWGSQNLAQQGRNTTQILNQYYGNNLEIVQDAPVAGLVRSYPGTPLRRGDRGPNVVVIQRSLNRIGQAYPSIPKINPVDGIFGARTEDAVRRFQDIFDLAVDGVVGKATWYALVRLYVGVNQLSELRSQGQREYNLTWNYSGVLQQGASGSYVRKLQYMLQVLSQFISSVPSLTADGIYGPATTRAVQAMQRYLGLPQTGQVDERTWLAIEDQYAGVRDRVFQSGQWFSAAADRQTAATGGNGSAPVEPTIHRQHPGQALQLGDRDPGKGEVRV